MIGPALRAAADFEGAAVACLRAALEVVQAAVDRSPFRTARVLRGMVHLRPGEGYSGLAVLQAGDDGLSDAGQDEALLPSATVWRRLEAARAPLAVDVAAHTVGVPGGATEPFNWPQPVSDALRESSQMRLLQRGASHLLVLPMHAPGGLVGMVSVETQCLQAGGTPFVWADCAAELEALVDQASPYLAALPRRQQAAAVDPLLPVVGPTMAPIVRVLRAFAAEDVTLLIQGETGTGKSRLARWAHAGSPRSRGPFEVLDLLAVPAETQMGELFGWRKGAFSGAVADHAGFVERAQGGTLFLDEIDKLSADAQAGLLTLLEDRRFRRLGDGSARAADVRFIVGTNADLRSAVAEGRFREDLYYRINVLPMRLPPLRERADEIADWARWMLDRHAPGATLDEAAVARLRQHTWPGNLRELDNLVRRAHTLSRLDGGAVVQAGHVEAAQGLDGRAGGPLQALAAALQGLCAHIEAHGGEGLADIDLGGALHGLLLAAAITHAGDRDDGFRLLDRAQLVGNRNHHKVLKRDLARLRSLCEALDLPLPAGVAALE